MSDEPECYWCHRRLTAHNATRDHLVPLSRGGAGIPDNKVDACNLCNSGRSSTPADAWRKAMDEALALTVKGYHPSEVARILARADGTWVDGRPEDPPRPPRDKDVRLAEQFRRKLGGAPKAIGLWSFP